jgi:hypothetical protein
MTTDIVTPEPEVVPDGLREYTVLAAAVTVVVGRTPQGRPEVMRLLRGDKINAEPSNESIRTLLSFRSIIASSKLEDGRERAVTARSIFEVSKRAGEATAVQDKAVIPIDAPLGTDTTV